MEKNLILKIYKNTLLCIHFDKENIRKKYYVFHLSLGQNSKKEDIDSHATIQNDEEIMLGCGAGQEC